MALNYYRAGHPRVSETDVQSVASPLGPCRGTTGYARVRGPSGLNQTSHDEACGVE